jgi:hypothetical protein
MPGRVFEGKTVSYDPAADLDALRILSFDLRGADTIIPVDASIAYVNASARNRSEIVVLGRHTFALDDRHPRTRQTIWLAVRWISQLD